MSSNRDYVMARLAAAQSQTKSIADQLDEVLSVMVDPGIVDEGEDDPRAEGIETAELAARLLVEELQLAFSGLEQLSEDELNMNEDEILDSQREEEPNASKAS